MNFCETDIENRLVVAKVEGAGREMEWGFGLADENSYI